MAAFVCSLLLIQELERLERISRRVFRDRGNAFDLPNHVFIRYFRLDKNLAIYVADKIKSSLPKNGLPAQIRVLVCLRFMATGGYQQRVANDLFLAVSQTSVSRCITLVSQAITNLLMAEWVKFPDLTTQATIKRRFLEHSGMPGAIGAIDCTHVAILKPPEDSERVEESSYLNQEGYHSINVQLVVDDKLFINAVNAKFPGSVHDAFIWKSSAIRNHLMDLHLDGHATGWLIGDRGYPLEPWLLTPFANPLPGTAEARFNSHHDRARSCVKQCIDNLKSRFRCLLKHRVLHYSPTQASFIINACVVLHNLCTKRGLEVEPVQNDMDKDLNDPSLDVNIAGPLFDAGRRLRLQIANNI